MVNKVVIAALLFASCSKKPAPTEYPRVVHNACTGAYAIRTGIVPWHYGREDAGYWGTPLIMGRYMTLYSNPDADTGENVQIGLEFQFTDSLTAIRKYLEWKERIRLAQEIAAKNWHREDSIYKCQHTYN